MRICHISNHEYDYDKEIDGCACTKNWADYEMPKTPLFGIVPGGSHPEAGRKKFGIQFDKDMHAYREARRVGERPDQVSVKAVEDAQKKLEHTDRLIKEGRVADLG